MSLRKGFCEAFELFNDMELDPKCLSVNATARMLHSVRSILAHRWSLCIFGDL